MSLNSSSFISFGVGYLFICSVQMSQAYEYHPTTESERIIQEPDRTIDCAGLDAIDVGIKSAIYDQAFNSSDGSKTFHMLSGNVYFTRDQIAPFLIRERHKSMLTVYVAKMRIGELFELPKFRPFLESLGYKRILVLQDKAFFPIPVLLDETLNDPGIGRREQIRAAQDQADEILKTNSTVKSSTQK